MKFTSRGYRWFSVLLALDAAVMAVITAVALVMALTGSPATTWWGVVLGAALTSGTAAGSSWCLRQVAKAGTDGAS